jgi:hypothetical protein
MAKLKTYNDHQKTKARAIEVEPSGVACRHCDGEMMKSLPLEDHYTVGRAGEAGAVKSGLHRAVCVKCSWRGWV